MEIAGIEVPSFPLGEGIEAFLDYFTEHFSFITLAISDAAKIGIEAIVGTLMWLPPWAVILIVAAIGWKVAGRRVAIFIVAGLALCWNLGLWYATMQTLTLVIISTAVAVTIGLPIGMAGAMFPRFKKLIMPILDFMQTMPAFVYLIPAIPFFGLGMVSAMFSTVIFSMPPAIRLTILGIIQVDEDLIEAADAFGSTKLQKLTKVQLPMATPSIMAGINQTIMLALSMVVIAAMIGAKGLGGEVWKAIQRLQPGNGFEAGLAVVILAMVLDRITQNLGGEEGKEAKT